MTVQPCIWDLLICSAFHEDLACSATISLESNEVGGSKGWNSAAGKVFGILGDKYGPAKIAAPVVELVQRCP